MRRRNLTRLIAAPLLLGSLLIAAIAVPAAGAPPPNAELQITKGFRKAVTLDGIREHQAVLQAIADANGGNRVSGTGGFDDSADYVVEVMTAAGYEVSTQDFTFTFVGDQTPPVFEQTAPNAQTYVDGVDFATMSYSGSGNATAQLEAVDLIVPSPFANASTSGCEAADFAGFTPGNIALIQRGTCTFRLKAVNAQAADAAGAVIFNEGNPGRTGIIFGTLSPPQLPFMVIGTTFALGDALRDGVLNGPTGITVHLQTDVIAEDRTARNVIAETTDGDSEHTIVIGAHLDSVSRGPGINDNGSGSATLLEIAQVYAEQDRESRNQLRFMWYGAEEFGLIGSDFYVSSLTQDEIDDIELMLNFDMLGSSNYVRYVYDGNNSSFPPGVGGVQPGPPGSGAIEQVFLDYFDAMLDADTFIGSSPTPFNGRSDYGPFIAPGVDIPAGGRFSGADGAKTTAEVALYGGTEGIQYDPCYHLACDTFAGTGGGTSPGLGLQSLDELSDGAAHAILLFSRRNFDMSPLVDPVIPVGGASTGAGGGVSGNVEARLES